MCDLFERILIVLGVPVKGKRSIRETGSHFAERKESVTIFCRGFSSFAFVLQVDLP